ncbi:MAG: glucose-6-phosphate isomerase [Candidatus Binatota bacterium]|jgi:glucose-6-phosphate isomerase|nr:glucose-6-phosphate isomerase [Candidatus Binatota bacterium]
MSDYRRRKWRDAMAVRVDVNGALDSLVGPGGITAAELEALAPRVAEIHSRLEEERRAKLLPFAELPYDKRHVREVVALADEVKNEFDTLVVLAIGGSALGADLLYRALRPPFHRVRPGNAERGLRLIVNDNIDPWTFGAILDEVDPRTTAFNVVSKSGQTAETVSRFLIVRDRLLKVLGAVDYNRHVIITTDTEGGELRQIVNDEGFRSLAIPPGVGGHFSVLSSAGLFPAAVAGIDVYELLAGAVAMDERCRSASIFENPAYLHGAVHHLAHSEKGRSVQVIWPYADSLAGVADWFKELWAESLGKRYDRSGREVFHGQTIVRAVGVSDQHAQLQLFAEGPNDKIITFLRVEEPGPSLEVPQGYSDLEGVAYLGGHSLGELLNLEQRGTEISLARRGRMTTTVHVPAVNAFTVGQLLHLFELQTVFVAALADVDPFPIPGVEESKRLAYAMAGRRGYEESKADVQVWLQKKDPRFVI